MPRAKLTIETLKVDSFTTGGGGAAVAERDERVGKVRNYGVNHTRQDFSCALENTGLCDTEGHCSTYCFAATSVCERC